MSELSAKHRKLWIISFVVALLGVGASLYSTFHHLELRKNGQTDASCNINSTVNCDAVAASKYSEIFNIPLGIWGLGFFIASAFLIGTILLRHKSSREHEPAWYALTGVGVLSSIGLAFISLGVLKAVCIVCVIIYVLNVILGVTGFMLFRDRKSGLDFSFKTLSGGLSSAAVAVAVVVLGYNFLKPAATLPPELQDLPGKHDKQAGNTMPMLAPNAVDIPINRSAYSGLGEDYRKGSDDAKVVIVEFADYMCPACGQTAPILEDLHKQLGNRVLLVFKNYPLSNKCNSAVQSDMHAHSCEIAKLARCAGVQGKFWNYHLQAFAEQSQASLESAKKWAKSNGLTDQQINECLESKDILAKIRDDVELANKIGVNSTPTIYINGRKYLGERSVQALRAAVESL